MTQEVKEPRQRAHKIIAIALPIVAIAMAFYHLAFTQYLLQDATGHKITHLGFAFVVVLLSMLLRNKQGWLLKWGLLIISLVVIGYFMLFLEDILTYRSAMPTLSDSILGTIAILLTATVSYLIFGKTFPIIALLFVAYLYFGRYLPFPFTVAAVSIQRGLVWLSTPGLEDGLFGSILGISANYLFLFILFGGLLQGFGGVRFIIGVGQWLGTKMRSGPAATAVLSSSLVGSVTGSTVANITITGSFTIPMMKQAGYEPEQAGAIEAAASNGGQIMPPIMGAAAFVMAGFTGIPYIQIIVAAIGPALLYYFGVLLYVELTARKLHIKVTKIPVSSRQLLLDSPTFLLPLGVLIFLLAQGYTLPFVAFWATMTLITTGLVSSIRKEARLNLKGVVAVITRAVITASEVAIVCALINVVVTSILVSGLGIMLPLLIQDISGGHLIIALLIAAASSILLGMGVPTVAAYLLVAVGLSPALAQMGVPVLQAHLFPLIFAVFSHLTPPVAIGALVASRIAGGEYWRTAWEALKAAFTAFLLPFLVIYVPVLILRPDGGFILSTTQIIALLLTVVSLQIAASNYGFTTLQRKGRLAFAAAGLLCLTFVFTQTYLYLIIGAAVFAVGIIPQVIRRRQEV